MESLQESIASRGLTLGLLGLLGLFGELLLAQGLGVWVELEEKSLIAERVFLLGEWAGLGLEASRADDGLNLVTVDYPSHIRVADLGSGQEVILLVRRGLVEGSEDFVKETESTLSPDDETTKVATGSELENVQPPDVDDLNTWQVTERLDDSVILIVDNERTTALTMSTVPELPLSGTEFTRVGNLDNIGVSLEGLEEGDGILGLLGSLNRRRDYKGNFLNLLNTVATSENKGRDGGSSQGRNNSKTALVLIDLDVPLTPGFGGGEHATTTAHVTEGGLARAVGAAATNTGNTSYGTTSTPRFSTSLVTSLLANGVSLPLVLSKALVHLLDDIEPDWGGEDGWER
jgi:hypothetical protein